MGATGGVRGGSHTGARRARRALGAALWAVAVGVVMLGVPVAGASSARAQPEPTTTADPTVPEANEQLVVSVKNNKISTDGEGRRVSTEEPVAGAEVSVALDGEEILRQATGEDGTFRVPLPGPGRYTVRLDTGSLPDGMALQKGRKAALELNVTGNRTARATFPLGQSQSQGNPITAKRVLQAFLEGLRFGLVIGITAVGLSLIFGVTGLTNFAHGEMVAFGALFAYGLNVTVGVPLVIAGLLAIAAGAGLGASLDRGIWRPLRGRGTSLVAQLVVSIGISLGLRYLFLMYFGGQTKNYTDFQGLPPVSFLRPTLNFNWVDLSVALISVVVLVVVAVMLQRTRIGKAMRAVSDNRDLASASGINVNLVITLVWTLGGGLAALGGVLQGLSDGVDWMLGTRLLLLMFAGVTLGGLGTAYGALVGSLVVGVFVQMSALIIPSELKTVGALLVLIVILVIRPQGIFGKSERIG